MMTTRATAVSGAAALILGWMGFATVNDAPPEDPADKSSPPRQVTVRLLGPAKGITGTTVPGHILAGKRPRFFQIAEPSLITVDLPNGNKMSLSVKSAFINTQVDVRTKTAVVVDVDLLPLPKSVPYRDAVAELRRLMRAMGVEPDEHMRKQMAGWPDDLPTHPPGSNPDLPSPSYRTGVGITESVKFEVVVRPAADGGWFLALTLAAAGDARRAVWDPNFKPPAEEKGKEPPSESDKK